MLQNAKPQVSSGRLRGRPLPGGLARLRHRARCWRCAPPGSRSRPSRSTAPRTGDALSATDRAEARAHLRAAAGAARRAAGRAPARARARPAPTCRPWPGRCATAQPGIRGAGLAALLLRSRRSWSGTACRSRGVRHLHAHHLQPGQPTRRCSPSATPTRAARAGVDLELHHARPERALRRLPLPARREGCRRRGGRLHQRLRPQPGDGLHGRRALAALARRPLRRRPDRVRSRRRRPRNGGAPAPDAFRVLYVGRLVPFKGQAILLEAIAALRARGIDARLTMIGEGPARAGAGTPRGRARARRRGPLRRRRRPGRDPLRTTPPPTSSACPASPRACRSC